MKYFVVSQNLLNSDLKLPDYALLRVNLAWHKDLASVSSMLSKYKKHKIFMDIPVGRKKPPNHKHDLDDVARLANGFDNVAYVAVSNVEGPQDLIYYCKEFKANIVPKIETYKGVTHAGDIIDALNYKPALLMLDHEDLFANLVYHMKEKHYLEVVQVLVDTCKKKKAHLLRAQGIIFSNGW